MRLRLTMTAATATVMGSIGLYPLFMSGGWFFYGVGGVLIVATVGAVTRRFRLPAPLCLLSGVGALLLYLIVLYARTEALYGLIPTPSSLVRLTELAAAGWEAANKYAAPVPLQAGISLLAVAGIGGVALAVDFLAVRVRRAAPAGLPLLAMYSVPAAVREENISWLAFLLGAAGFLALLLADAREQVSGWGRPVFTRRRSPREAVEAPETSALAVTGRRIGLTALVIAVALPLAVPGVQTKGLFGLGGLGERAKVTRITMPDPLVSMKRQLTLPENAAILTYRGSPNAGSPEYLRVTSLDRFDGEQWTMRPVRTNRGDRIDNRRLPPPPGLLYAPKGQVSGEILVDGRVDRVPFLPMPYPPTRVDIGGDWRVDRESLMVFALREVGGGIRYRVTSFQVQPTEEQLQVVTQPRQEVAERYLDVPRSVPNDIVRLTKDITDRAATPYTKAVKLQRWFTKPGRFTYNTQVPSPRQVSALRDFLLRSRTGYCEQFAASMALMARIIDIPARVAVGYTQGAPGRQGGEWVVNSHDAHAWPELYFEGLGWLRFEPTPAGTGGQGTANVPPYAEPDTGEGAGSRGQESGSPDEGASSAPTPAAPGNAVGQRRREPADRAAGGAARNTRRPGDQLPVGWLLGAAGVLLVLLTPLAGRHLTRRRRWASARHPENAAHAAWAELHDDVVDHGLGWNTSESPRAAARRIEEGLEPGGPAAEALGRIARAEEKARYAPAPANDERLREDGLLVRAALATAAGRGSAVRARLMPMSTLVAYRRTGWRVLEAFDWLDLLGTRRRIFGRSLRTVRPFSAMGLLRGDGANAPRSGP